MGKLLNPGKCIHFERVYLRADFLDGPYTFVAEDHIDVLVVLVGAAHSCVGDFEEDFVRGECVLVSLGLDDPSGLVALVHGVIQIQLHRDGFWESGVVERLAIYLGGLLMMS